MQIAGLNRFKSQWSGLLASLKEIGLSYRVRPNFDIIREVVQNRLSTPAIMCDGLESYSQNGEDVIIASLLRAAGIEPNQDGPPQMLELGTNHPVNMNNSWLLLKQGFRSVLVEPNIAYHGDIKKMRPDDILLPVAVAPEAGQATLYIPFQPEVASLSRAFVEDFYRRRKLDPKIIEKPVELVTLNSILDEHFADTHPAVLAIDIEGMDFGVLENVDWAKWRPTVFCIERSISPALRDNMRDLMAKHGYSIVAATPVNDIYTVARETTPVVAATDTEQ